MLEERKLSEQLATPRVVVGVSWHWAVVNASGTPVSEKATVPDGVTAVPEFDGLSVTVAVHVDAWLTTTGLLHETVVTVVRTEMVTVAAVPVRLPR